MSKLRRLGVFLLPLALFLAASATNATSAREPGELPFRDRAVPPEFSAQIEWLNTDRPITLRQLRGKFVLLDFWTYCCINCHHVIPELKKLEAQFPNELVVLGIHTPKFDNERETGNLRKAVLRHEIDHPVANDRDRVIWRTYGVTVWPTIVLIDPEGFAVARGQGEFKAGTVAEVLRQAIPIYRRRGSLDERPFPLVGAPPAVRTGPLRFPGKLAVDFGGGRLFISDTNHNRILIAQFAPQSATARILDVIGSGKTGRADGGYREAAFNKPQGITFADEKLYVADTENHLIRRVDLAAQTVATLAGTGEQARGVAAGGPPLRTALASPWDLLIHGDHLYVAMAGTHQLWRMALDGGRIAPYAGNRHEDVVDGPLLPGRSAAASSSFAQPSGLASDGRWLFVADSEGSSIRAAPLNIRHSVRTLVGTAALPHARLFTFGDRDGPAAEVLLQHPLGVAYADGTVYVADTYNHKVKQIDTATERTATLSGDGQPGLHDGPGATARFYEPGDVEVWGNWLVVADTNNHAIRLVDRTTGDTRTVTIALPATIQPSP